MSKKILFIAANARSLIANRGDLIQEMKQRGHTVHALVPDYDFLPEVEELGISWELIQLSRTGVDPAADLKTYRQLKACIRRFGPDVVFGYSIKPVIYGTLAAKACGVPVRGAMITGMGYLFTGESLRQRVLRLVASQLYRAGLRAATTVFFQNPDDLALFRKLGIISEKDMEKVVRTNGSGVNMGHFERTDVGSGEGQRDGENSASHSVSPSLPLKRSPSLPHSVSPSQKETPNNPIRFLVIARLLQDKGVREFVKAAEVVLWYP